MVNMSKNSGEKLFFISENNFNGVMFGDVSDADDALTVDDDVLGFLEDIQQSY